MGIGVKQKGRVVTLAAPGGAGVLARAAQAGVLLLAPALRWRGREARSQGEASALALRVFLLAT